MHQTARTWKCYRCSVQDSSKRSRKSSSSGPVSDLRKRAPEGYAAAQGASAAHAAGYRVPVYLEFECWHAGRTRGWARHLGVADMSHGVSDFLIALSRRDIYLTRTAYRIGLPL